MTAALTDGSVVNEVPALTLPQVPLPKNGTYRLSTKRL